MLPVRCFTCGAVIANLWCAYKDLIKDGATPNEALDRLNRRRYCCRRMFLSHLDLTDKLSIYDVSGR